MNKSTLIKLEKSSLNLIAYLFSVSKTSFLNTAVMFIVVALYFVNLNK